MSRFLFVLSVVLAAFACYCTDIKADWQLVQNSPVKLYRDTRTGLDWSVTLGKSNNDYSYARRVVDSYGLRLPTWEELRDVVDNNNAVDMLEIQSDKLDFYETNNPNVYFRVYKDRSKSKPRSVRQTFIIGVRK